MNLSIERRTTMTRSRIQASLAGAMLATAAVAGAVWAATPTQADMDYCNQQAAAGLSGSTSSTPPPGGPTTTPPARPGDMSQTRGNMGQSPQPGGTPSSSSTSSGISSSQATGQAAPGMATTGNTDPRYRQMYVSCLQQRSH
jgi:hypothetical protein